MNYSISKIIPYVRRYVLLGIYDVLDGERVPYQKKEDTVVAKAEVYGNLSTFSISAEEQEMGTELKVTMLQSCVGLSEQGKERAMTAVMDRIVQYLENEETCRSNKAFDLGSGTSRCDNYRFFNWGNTTRCACFQLGV